MGGKKFGGIKVGEQIWGDKKFWGKIFLGKKIWGSKKIWGKMWGVPMIYDVIASSMFAPGSHPP